MTQKSTAHIIMNNNTSTLQCLHCESEYKVNLPCPIRVFTAACDAFTMIHVDCVKQEDA